MKRLILLLVLSISLPVFSADSGLDQQVEHNDGIQGNNLSEEIVGELEHFNPSMRDEGEAAHGQDAQTQELKEQFGLTDYQVSLLREVSGIEMQLNELQNIGQDTLGGARELLGSFVAIEFAHRVLCALDENFPVCNLKDPAKFMKDVWRWSPWFGSAALVYSVWSVLSNASKVSISVLRYVAERQLQSHYTNKLAELKQNLKMTGNRQLAEQL